MFYDDRRSPVRFNLVGDSKAEFGIKTAHGAIAYQASRGRGAAAEERFHVRGALAVSCLGVDSVVQMDEVQCFQLRLLDRNPLGK